MIFLVASRPMQSRFSFDGYFFYFMVVSRPLQSRCLFLLVIIFCYDFMVASRLMQSRCFFFIIDYYFLLWFYGDE